MTRVTLLAAGAGVALLVACALPPAAAAAERVADITFDDVKFEMEKGGEFRREMLPRRVEQLDGKRVRIRGYILPSFKQHGLTQFVLVRDNMQCCFGPGAALFDAIVVKMEADKTTSFSVRPVAVEGTFQIREMRGPDGKYLAIYLMKGYDVQ